MHLLSLTARESEFDESIEHYARSYELSRAVWAARSPKFRYEIRASQDLWFASAHATMAARFDPEDSLLMRNALRAAYDSGASHLLIADKYVVLAMLAALEADVDAAVESLSKAEQLGFRRLYRLEVMGLLEPLNHEVWHGFNLDPRFADIIERIREKNERDFGVIAERYPQLLDPVCFSDARINRNPDC